LGCARRILGDGAASAVTRSDSKPVGRNSARAWNHRLENAWLLYRDRPLTERAFGCGYER